MSIARRELVYVTVRTLVCKNLKIYAAIRGQSGGANQSL